MAAVTSNMRRIDLPLGPLAQIRPYMASLPWSPVDPRVTGREGRGNEAAGAALPAPTATLSSQVSVDVGALDQECDPYVGAPLVEVLPAQPGGDDVYRADVPERALRLFQRLLCGVIRRLLGASDQLNDLYDGHEPSSFSARWFAASVLLHVRPRYKP